MTADRGLLASGNEPWGRAWYEGTFLPKIGPWALYGLWFTIVILFAPQGDAITSGPLDVAPIAIPLLAYVALMWGGGFGLGAGLGLGYERTTTPAFTGAGNNFELAIAVAIATFGAASGRLWPASSDRSSKYRPSSVLSTPASPCVGDSAPAHPTGHGPTHVPGPVRRTEVRANRAAR